MHLSGAPGAYRLARGTPQQARLRSSARLQLHGPRRGIGRRPCPIAALDGKAAAATAASLRPSSATAARLARVLDRFSGAGDAKATYTLLLRMARQLEPFPKESQVAANRVMGCTAQVWISARLAPDGTVWFSGSSDSELTKGLCAVLIEVLSGLQPQEVQQVDASFLRQLHLGAAIDSPSRANGFANMLQAMKRRARELAGDLPRFPSLRITAHSQEPQGAFAEAQAQFLEPDMEQVEALVALLHEKRIGVVAHFYMDPEVQGVLSSAAERWPHIRISDSLVMADTAVAMAHAGCQAVAVLGVDFMSENVRAILDQQGFAHVPVYRMSDAAIGCSLAEAAESTAYHTFLEAAAAQPRSLHVVYINTSLLTKALSQQLVPTITCTSSNVVQTVMQAFAQVPDATVWYGPDTYMGRNLAQLFSAMASWPDEEIQRVHPDHNQASVQAFLPRLLSFEEGTCIVHHIFGGRVCELVRQGYGDAYLTAHFEVPGEMFTLAMQAKQERGMGVVGSTSNILDFIAGKVQGALDAGRPDTLRFVLGTEAGMITAIVRKVQSLLRDPRYSLAGVDVEVVFPVEPSSITTGDQLLQSGRNVSSSLPGGLALVPGPASGEGCSLAGGCAACPYMKMNTLAALRQVPGYHCHDQPPCPALCRCWTGLWAVSASMVAAVVCERMGHPAGEALLQHFIPRPYTEALSDGLSIAQAGCVPILHMRHFQQHKTLSQELVGDILGRHGAAQRGAMTRGL